jgi:hypothetical protein
MLQELCEYVCVYKSVTVFSMWQISNICNEMRVYSDISDENMVMYWNPFWGW